MVVTVRTPSNLKFRDDVEGNYNISFDVTDITDDDIAAALMMFKVGELCLDEVMCYFGYRLYQEAACKNKIRKHDKVVNMVRAATQFC